MKDKFETPYVDLYSIGHEMMRASRFEEMYYEMEKDRNEWRDKYQEQLDSSFKHSNAMMNNLLEMALYGPEGKKE
jgi:hypothetical protein